MPKDLRQLRHLSLHYLKILAGADRQELIAEAEHLGIAQASWYFLPDQDPTLVDLMTREDPAKQREDLMKASRYDEAKEQQPFIALTLLSRGQRILCESDHSPLPISADRRAREALALARLMTLPEHHVYIASHLAGILDLSRDLSPVQREKLVREIMRRLRKAPPHTFPAQDRSGFGYSSGRFRAPMPRLIEGLVRAEAFPELLEALDLVMRMRRDFPQTSFEEVSGQFMLGMFRHHQPGAYFQWLRSPLTSMVGPDDLAGFLKDIDWSKANIDELIPSLQTPLLRAQLWAHLGDQAALTEELDQWRHADLTDSPLLVAAGRHALSEGQLEQANADFHRAVSWTKVTPSSRHALGGLLECALEAGPSQPILWKDGKRAAWRLRKQRAFRRNSELFVAMNVLGLDPDFPRPRPFLGELERPSVDWRWEHQVDQLVAAGDGETALRLILRAVHGYQIAYLAGGDARPEALLKAVSRSKLDRAVMAAVSRDPTMKAVYLDWLGENEKAEIAYRESLKISPDNHAIRGRLASLLAASDSDQAIALLLEIPANELDSYYLEKAFRGLNWYERIQGQLRTAETGIRYLEKRIEQGDISAASRWIKALKARLERAFREPDDPSWTLPRESEANDLERKGDPLALERRRLLQRLNHLIASASIDVQ